MSLPDTVFIFVLALIIFGPKKLPEIGRQIGRLVGEFRRASNEFKFQIEEELRQVERTDPPHSNNTIAPPTSFAAPESADLSLSAGDDKSYLENEVTLSESLAAGQHPNPDAMQEVVDSSYAPEPATERTGGAVLGESEIPVSLATLTAAVGTQPRSTVPYAPTPKESETAKEPADEIASHPEEPHAANGFASDTAPTPSHSASPEAEIHHG
jgi:TatA/E family protein of Tat protein translocase